MRAERNRVLIVKSNIPKYDLDFYNSLGENSDYDILVTSDTNDNSVLNDSRSGAVNFKVLDIQELKIGPFYWKKGIITIINSVRPDIVIFQANPRELSYLPLIIYNTLFLKQGSLSWSMYHRIGGIKLFSDSIFFLGSLFSLKTMCYSEVGERHQLRRRVSPSKIRVVGTAIDEQRIFRVKEALDADSVIDLRAKHNLGGQFLLLQVMRLTAIKKPELLVDLVENLKSKIDRFTLILIGGGDCEGQVKSLLSARGLASFVLFVGPIYSESELAKWFSMSDVFVVPTCIGLSAHHAFAYGLPVITDSSLTNQASEFEIIEHGYNALIYPEGDIDAFADNVIMLKNNASMRKELSKNACATVSSKYSLRSKVNNFLKIIDDCLG
jgi:glycosyltransferase involved in cell wall biosynthesis